MKFMACSEIFIRKILIFLILLEVWDANDICVIIADIYLTHG
jgi:hypothetical protein